MIYEVEISDEHFNRKRIKLESDDEIILKTALCYWIRKRPNPPIIHSPKLEIKDRVLKPTQTLNKNIEHVRNNVNLFKAMLKQIDIAFQEEQDG